MDGRIWPSGSGEMAERIRVHDWATTPLGPVEGWSERLKAVVELVLASPLVSSLVCGSERVLIYNDAAARLYGARHPAALGRPLPDVFPEGWEVGAALYQRVFAGEPVQVAAQPLDLHGEPGRAPGMFDATLTPVRDETGRVVAAHMVGLEVGARLAAEARLRESEERQAYLLRLSDALRPLEEPVAIQREACRTLRRQVGAIRVAYAEMRPDDRTCTLLAEDVADPGLSLAGMVADWDDFDPLALAAARRGQTFSREDLQAADDLTPERKATFASLNVRAFIVTPLVKAGRLVAFLVAQFEAPRGFSPCDVAITEETAERTWAAVERARAEAALQESEAKFRTLFEGLDEGLSIQELILDADGRVVDWIYREANSAFERQGGFSNPYGRRGSEIVPHVGQDVLDLMDRVARTGEPERSETYVPDTDRHFRFQTSRIGGPGSRLLAVVFEDISDRKRAEASLRESEERQVFLLKLSDALRAEPSADAIADRALRMLSDQMGLDRCYITLYRPTDDEADFPYQVGNDTVPPLPPKVRLSDFPDAYEQVLEQTFVLDDDFERRGLSEAERASSKALGMRAMLASTLRRGEKNPLCSMVAVSSRPRHWSPAEIALVEETAERTWAAMERARAEATLRDSEARFRALAMAGGSIVYHMSPDWRLMRQLDGRDLLADTAEPAEDWAEGYILPEDRPAVFAAIEAAIRAGSMFELEHRMRRADGGIAWVLSRAVPVLGADGAITEWFGTATDVTSRKGAEEALRASEERLARALEAGELGAWELDLTTLDAWRSPQHDRIFGYESMLPEWTYGMFLDHVVPEDRGQVDAAFQAATAGGGRWDFECRIRRADGKTRWIWAQGRVEPRADGRPGRILGMVRDVTERREAEERVRESEERQAFLLALSDALSRLTTPAAIAAVTLARLRERLATTRVCYGEIVGDLLTVEQDCTSGVPSIVGEHSLEPFGPEFIAAYGPGAVIRVGDVEHDPRLVPAARASLRAIQVAAFADAVLFEDGGEVGVLAVQSATPRAWSGAEEGLIREVAERVRSAVKRARAEEALRASEARLREFGEASQDVLWIRDAETLRWTYLTPAFETIYGVGREEALAEDSFRTWTDLILPEDRARAVDSIARVREGERVTFEYRVRRPDGQVRWLRNTDFPIRDEAGRVVRIGGVGQDVTELKAIEAALRDSEGRLRTLTEGIPQLVWRSCGEGLWTWASAQWLAFTGQQPEETYGLGWLDAVHPDDREPTMQAWEAARPSGTLDVEYRVRRASDGAYLWHHTRSVPVRDEAGRIVEWLGTSTDVQQLKELQERQAVMVAELQHRTRNLIAVVRSIAGQTMAMTGPGEAFREEFNHRLEALARVQGLLSRAGEEPIGLEALIRMELDALGAREMRERVHLAGPAVGLRHSVVQTLALALHELATNARKYGALSTEGGRLGVTWRIHEDAEGPRLGLEWVETGGPPPDLGSEARRGYGRELIERALPYSLSAKTSFSLGEAGLVCTIDMPLERPRDRRQAA